MNAFSGSLPLYYFQCYSFIQIYLSNKGPIRPLTSYFKRSMQVKSIHTYAHLRNAYYKIMYNILCNTVTDTY